MSPQAADTPLAERAPRADALRNRAKVLDGARRAFAEEGLDADMASIARRAGVGVGTVYRHFETKEALLLALALDHFERLADIAEGLEGQEADPWAALERLVWETATHSAHNVGMCEILARQAPEVGTMPAAQRLRRLTGRFVDAAREAGAARADASVDDIPMMMCGFGKIAAVQQNGGMVDWQRYLRLMLDGLRAR
jgi:AcrR family transcriptional regulator